MITLHVNGESRQVAATTVAELLDELQVGAGPVAVELNREIVPKGLYAEKKLCGEDRLEIVTAVGGG